MNLPDRIELPTRVIDPGLVSLLRSLTAGQKIQVTQSIRVGARKWTTTATGSFRGIDYLATGVTTDRVPEDDVVIPMVHFTKDNGELSSIAIDENTVVQAI